MLIVNLKGLELVLDQIVQLLKTGVAIVLISSHLRASLLCFAARVHIRLPTGYFDMNSRRSLVKIHEGSESAL